MFRRRTTSSLQCMCLLTGRILSPVPKASTLSYVAVFRFGDISAYYNPRSIDAWLCYFPNFLDGQKPSHSPYGFRTLLAPSDFAYLAFDGHRILIATV